MFGSGQLLVADPLAVGKIYKDIEIWHRSPRFVRNLESVMGRNVATMNDVTEHTRLRHALNPAFSGSEIARHLPAMYDVAEDLVHRMHARMDSSMSSTTEMDMFRLLNRAGLDIIGKCMFNYPNLGDPTNPLSQAVTSMLDVSINHTPLSMLQVLFLTLSVIPTTYTRCLAENREIVANICQQIVDDAKGRGGEKGALGDGIGNDMLSRLVHANMSPEVPASARLTDLEFRDHVSTLIVAGSETTTSTAAFALLRLAQNPGVQDKLRAEIAERPCRLSYADLNSLDYLDAVVHEALRLYPALPQQDRVAIADTVLPLSTPVQTLDGKKLNYLDIKKGTVVTTPLVSINQSTDVWGPNALEFSPERHLMEGEYPSKLPVPPPYGNIMTFINGRKHCLGYRLAVAELKTILSTLLRHFRFDVAEGVEIEGRIGFVVRPQVKSDQTNTASLVLKVSPIA